MKLKNILSCTGFLVVFLVLGIPHAHAQDVTTTSATAIVSVLAFIIMALNFLMWFLFAFLDIFLDPAFIFGIDPSTGESSLMDMLQEIWMLSRDLLNVVFALMLVAGAIVTIVQAKSDKVKEYLPKFLLAVVVVNFSWFIPRVVIDIAQVMTYTVFEIPSLLNRPCQVIDANKNILPCKIVMDYAFLGETASFDDKGDNDPTNNEITKTVNGTATTTQGWECPIPGAVCVQYQPWNSANASAHKKVVHGLLVNHARMGTLATVTNSQILSGKFAGADILKQIGQLIILLLKVVLILVMHIGLFFPVAALAIAFFVRIPILWVTMAFMPFAAIGFLIGEFGGFNTWDKIWKKFLAMASLPVIAGVPLTVGFIMINAGQQISNTVAESISLPIIVGIDNLWQFVWLAMAFLIMWVGTFMVLKQDEIISKAVSPIESTGKTLGSIALKAPLAAPILPMPGGGPKESILQQMLKPKQLLADINADGVLGPAGGAGNEVQLTPGAKEAVKIINENDIHVQVGDKLKGALANPTKEAVRQLIDETKTKNAGLQGMNDEDVLRGLGAAARRTEQEIQGLIDKLKEPDAGAGGGGAGGDGGGGA